MRNYQLSVVVVQRRPRKLITRNRRAKTGEWLSCHLEKEYMHANRYRYFQFFVVGLQNDYIDKKTSDVVLNKTHYRLLLS